MISIGGHYRGPELSGSPIQKLLRAAGTALLKECGHFGGGDDVAGPDRLRGARGAYLRSARPRR